jgi:hypothetical protein
LPFLDLFAKAGVSTLQFDGRLLFDTQRRVLTEQESDEGLAWGGGFEARLRSAGVRVEYERFADLDALSLSLTWTFD